MKFIYFWYDCDSKKSNYYETCYLNLKKQLDTLGYEYSIDNLKIDNPNYKTINFHKPSFIEQKIKELNDSVLWIDIDCSFIQRVDELQNLKCDVGLFMRNKQYDIGQWYYDIGTPHACFMFFNNTQNSLEFIKPWKDMCEKAKLDPTIKETEHAYLIDYFRNNNNTKYDICKFENYCTSSISEIKTHKIFVGISQSGLNYDKGMCGWENKG